MKNQTYIQYIWYTFFAFLGLVAAWFTISAGIQLYDYFSMQNQVNAKSVKWNSIEITDEKYILGTEYTYEVEGASYDGKTRMTSYAYRNPWAANQAIEKYSNQEWPVWYSKSYPEKSTMQNQFPLKDVLSTILLWGLFGYFFWLSSYVARYGNNIKK